MRFECTSSLVDCRLSKRKKQKPKSNIKHHRCISWQNKTSRCNQFDTLTFSHSSIVIRAVSFMDTRNYSINVASAKVSRSRARDKAASTRNAGWTEPLYAGDREERACGWRLQRGGLSRMCRKWNPRPP